MDWPLHRLTCSPDRPASSARSALSETVSPPQNMASSSDSNEWPSSVIVPIRDGFLDCGMVADAERMSLSPIMQEHAAKLHKAQYHPRRWYPPNLYGKKR